jgi:AraC-like DNA-binding protein/quercetin dioxygenase-like cupin family protein
MRRFGQAADPIILPLEFDEPSLVDAVPRAVVALSFELPLRAVVAWHEHRRAQLVYCGAGALKVSTPSGIWIVPPQRAVWVPPGTPHQLEAVLQSSLRTLYVSKDARSDLQASCGLVEVSPLLRELILRAVLLPPEYEEAGQAGRLMAVMLEEIDLLASPPVRLPWPSSRMLATICAALHSDPADPRGLAEWARALHTSPRTLARRFRAETGMGFRLWRQSLRVLLSLERLCAGQPVKTIALDLGFHSQSAYIAMFRRLLGTTPGKYFRASTER